MAGSYCAKGPFLRVLRWLFSTWNSPAHQGEKAELCSISVPPLVHVGRGGANSQVSASVSLDACLHCPFESTTSFSPCPFPLSFLSLHLGGFPPLPPSPPFSEFPFPSPCLPPPRPPALFPLSACVFELPEFLTCFSVTFLFLCVFPFCIFSSVCFRMGFSRFPLPRQADHPP